MNRIAYIAVLMLAACSDAHERSVDEALRIGNAYHQAGELQKALEAYMGSPEDNRTSFNAGVVLQETGQWTEAVERYTLASNMADSVADRAKALYNLGHVWSDRAMLADSTARQAGEQARSITLEGDINDQVRLVVIRDSLLTLERELSQLTDSALLQSEDAYRNVLRLTPTEEDARHNLALVIERIAARPKPANNEGGKDPNKDRDLGEKAKLIMARADELVEKYLFQEALDVMRQGVQQDPTLQQRKDYMDKLDMITKAARPS